VKECKKWTICRPEKGKESCAQCEKAETVKELGIKKMVAKQKWMIKMGKAITCFGSGQTFK
jgi:hypothetical protein